MEKRYITRREGLTAASTRSGWRRRSQTQENEERSLRAYGKQARKSRVAPRQARGACGRKLPVASQYLGRYAPATEPLWYEMLALVFTTVGLTRANGFFTRTGVT